MRPYGNPLTTCPMCGYSLEGLPLDYKCPECAFEYDHKMRIWWAGKPWMHVVGLVAGAFCLLASITWLFRPVLSWWEAAYGVGFLIAGIYWTVPSLRRLRHRPFVIVGRSDIMCRSDTNDRKMIPLADLRIAHGTSRILIFRSDDPDPLGFPPMLSGRAIREIKEYIVECWQAATGKKPEEIPWNRDWYADNVVQVGRDGRIRRPRPQTKKSE